MYVLIIGVALILATGGGTNPYSQILILVFTGIYLLVVPPKHLPDKWIVRACLALLAWVAISTWVPMPFHCATDWLKEHQPGLIESGSVSAQPWLSTEKSLFLICALAWLFIVLDRPINHYGRVKCMVLLNWVLAILGLVTIVGIIVGFKHPLSWETHRFSFFTNYNQSGMMLAMAGILSMGMIIRTVKRRDWKVIFFMMSFGVSAFAITLGMSRSSFLALTVGCILNFILALEGKNFRFYLKLGIPFFLVLIAVFVSYSGTLLDEFMNLVKSGGITEEFRVWIFIDSLRLISHFPVFGVGLGNFRYFLPFFQESVNTVHSIYHPESDFLWLLSELGLVGVIIVSAGIYLLFRRLDPRDILRTKGSRLIGLLALGLFLLINLFEVSGHRLGTILLVCIFYGLTQPETAILRKSRVLPVLSRVCAVLMLVIAGFWTVRKFNNDTVTRDDVMRQSEQSLNEYLGDRNIEDAISQIDGWLSHYPMMYQLHSLRGRLALNAGHPIDEVDTDFRRSQFLMPIRWRPFIYNGIFIHEADFDAALDYWRAGIRVAKDDAKDAFRTITSYVSKDLYPGLRDLVYTYPSLKYFYFSGMKFDSARFVREFGLELAINPELNGFNPDQKRVLLWKYIDIVGVPVLRQLVTRYPHLADEDWRFQALLAADDENYEEACSIARKNVPPVEMIDLTDGRVLNFIRTEYLRDSDDPLKGIAMIQKQISDGFYEDACITIQIVLNKNVKRDYLEYELALVYDKLGRYEESWALFKKTISNPIRW